MNPKKCPKCGESNPPEAVMCWACYTPLSGSATGGGPSAQTAPAQAADSEKKAIPPWQMGVVGFGLLVLLGFGAKMMLGGGGGGDSDDNKVSAPSAKKSAPAPATDPGVVVPTPPSNPPAASNTAQNSVPEAKLGSFTVAVAPNPRFTWGTMAIVPSESDVDARGAAQLAVFAREQMMRNKKWAILQIYVFANKQTAQAFKQYEDGRRGAPLQNDDFQKLSDLWPSTLVRYEYNRGAEGILIPSREPSSWWGDKTVYWKAREDNSA